MSGVGKGFYAKKKGVPREEVARRKLQSEKDTRAFKRRAWTYGKWPGPPSPFRQRPIREGKGSQGPARQRSQARPFTPGRVAAGSQVNLRRGKGVGIGVVRGPPNASGLVVVRSKSFEAKLKHALHIMYHPGVSPVRSRVETVRFRASFNLAMSATGLPPSYQPTILFRPTHANINTTVIPGLTTGTAAPTAAIWTTTFAGMASFGGGDSSNIVDWVDDKVGVTSLADGLLAVTNYTPSYAEAISTPISMSYGVKSRTMGGIVRIRITCGPTARGYLVVRKLNGSDSNLTPATLYAAMSGISGNTRFPLSPSSVMTYFFTAPVENIAAKSTFYSAQGNYTPMTWAYSLYAPIAFSFREVAHSWNSDTAPLIEYSTVTSFQAELDPMFHHISNVDRANSLTDAQHVHAVEAVSEGGLAGYTRDGEVGAGVAGLVAAAARANAVVEGVAAEVGGLLEMGAILL